MFVPHYAMSDGTLIALAADEMVICEHAVLGPIDSQLGQDRAASLIRVAHQNPMAETDDQTLIRADQAEKTLAEMESAVSEVLANSYAAEKETKHGKLLTTGTWTHDHPLTCKRARELGLPVRNEMPQKNPRLDATLSATHTEAAVDRGFVGSQLPMVELTEAGSARPWLGMDRQRQSSRLPRMETKF